MPRYIVNAPGQFQCGGSCGIYGHYGHYGVHGRHGNCCRYGGRSGQGLNGPYGTHGTVPSRFIHYSATTALSKWSSRHLLVLNVPGLSLQHLSPKWLPMSDQYSGPTRASHTRTHDRPVQAQDLDAFKSDIVAMMRDMIKSSLNNFDSQSRFDPVGKEKSSREKELSPDREPSRDREVPPELEEGEVVPDHEDSDLDQGNPNSDQLMLTAEEQRDRLLLLRLSR